MSNSKLSKSLVVVAFCQTVSQISNVLRLIFFCSFFPATVISQTIYVSPAGNDKNPGTHKKPVQTVARAQQRARTPERNQGACIIFATGIYYLPETIVFSSEDGGDTSHPVKQKDTIQARNRNALFISFQFFITTSPGSGR